MLPKSSVPVPGNEVDVWLYSRWIGLEHEVDEAGQELVGRGRILIWNLEHVKHFLGAPEKEWKQNWFCPSRMYRQSPVKSPDIKTLE